MPQIRLAPSGAPIIGNNPGDLLVWDGTEWVVMPGGGGGVLMGDADGAIGDNRVTSLSQVGLGVELVPISSLASSVTEVSVFVLDVGGTDFFTIPLSVLLAATALNGDADGPAGNNRVTSLSEVGLGIEQVPITSLASDPGEPSVVITPPGGGSLLTQTRSAFLGSFQSAWDFILTSRADLLAVPGVGAGPVFQLPSGSYAIKVGFALNANERLNVANGVSVLMASMGPTKVLSGDPGANPLLNVEAGGVANLFTLNLTSTANGSQAVACAGTVESWACNLRADTTGGQGVLLTAGEWRDTGSTFRGGTSNAINQQGGRLALTDSILSTGLGDGLNVNGAVACQFNLKGVTATSTSGNGVECANANAVGKLTDCDLTSSASAGLVQSAGQLRAEGCNVVGATNGVTHSGGNARYSACDITPGTGACLDASGASAYTVRLTDCNLFATASDAVIWNAASADLFAEQNQFDTQLANGNCVRVQAASTIQIKGGRMSTNAVSRGSGLSIQGNIAGGLQFHHVHGENISTSDASGEGLVQYVSGTVRRASIMGCDTATTVATAVNWASASIPTLGLALVGNAWDDPSPYNGFTHTSARVNSKANLLQTGLMSETPIVP